MAVSVKPMNGIAAIKKLGVGENTVDFLLTSGFITMLNAQAFDFVNPDLPGDQNPVAKVPVTLTVLKALSSNTLGITEKEKLAKEITMAVIKLQNAEQQPSKPKGALDMLPQSLVGKVTDLAGVDYAKVEAALLAQSAKWAPFDTGKLKTAPLMKLRDATRMYQPVYGTSAGSRYYLVAGNEELRIAARYQGQKLSVRIEGPDWKKHIPSIAKAGISKPDGNEDYTSLHLTVPNDIVARKALGAIILGLGVPMDTPMPNLSLIKNM